MKKLLYIDPFCPYGHINFNKTYVNALLRYDKIEVHLALKEGYIHELGLPLELLRLSIPTRLFVDRKNSAVNRLSLLLIYWYVRYKLHLRDYDYIFLSGYEEISFFFSGFKGKIFLVNHNNVANLDNFIKRLFIKNISKKCVQVVFSDFIRKRYLLFGIKNVLVLSQGLPEPYYLSDAHSGLLLNKNSKLLPKEFNLIIFVPSGSKYDSGFLKTLIADSHFIDFLKTHKILLAIKSDLSFPPNANLLIIEEPLETEHYISIFLNCDVVLLIYPESFKFRVSALLLECFSNNKMCLLSNIESFRTFAPYFKYNPFFDSARELESAIETAMSIKGKKEVYYHNLEEFKITFDALFNNDIFD